MTSQRPDQPPRCHYTRDLGERVTRAHTDACDGQDCDGCQPCTLGHCSVCTREHLDDAHPNTCPSCVSSIREDLDELARLCRQLRGQAAYASNDGRPWAAAPIPGANAMVLVGPSAQPDEVQRGKHYADDHRRGDPTPPLAILATWEDTWRAWLQQPAGGRASIARAVDYLDEQLTLIAQTGLRLDSGGQVTRPPEFPEFARAIGRLRAQLEQTLHDEQAPDRGVECFECGARLVRRHRDPKRCTHETPARVWFGVLFTYPEIPIRPTEVAAARAACPRCDQGGLQDPTPGISWECPSCRMCYTPGQYANAVRSSLIDEEINAGWSTFPAAADAAADITGRPITVATIRKWIERKDEIATVCVWEPGHRFGQQLVFWPDVAVRAAETRRAGRRRVA